MELAAELVEMDSLCFDVLVRELALEYRGLSRAASSKIAGQQSGYRVVDLQNFLQIISGRMVETCPQRPRARRPEAPIAVEFQPEVDHRGSTAALDGGVRQVEIVR